MRIFVQNGSITQYMKHLMILIVLFSCLFWVIDVVNAVMIYGYSYEDVYLYFYSDFEYPEIAPFNALIENVHINLYTSLLFNVFFLPLFLKLYPNKKFAFIISLIIFTFSLLYSVSDIAVYLWGVIFIYIKLISFLSYKVLSLVALVVTFILIVYKQVGRVYVGGVNFIVLIFSFSSLLFLLINLIMFYTKLSFNPENIYYYYNGNEELFIKGKSFESIISVLALHIVSGGVFVFVLSHFYIFTEFIYKGIAIYLSFVSTIIEFLSGFFIKMGLFIFTYIKLISFFMMEFLLAFITLYVIKDILKGKLQWTSKRNSQELS